TDTLSGIAGADTIDLNITTEGQNQTATATFMDQAGNIATATIDRINIDMTAPTVAFGAPNPAPNAAGWNNTDVSMSFTTSDNLPGCVSSTVSIPISFTTEGINLKATVTVTDAAGNSATFTSAAVNIDKTAPTVLLGSLTPTPNPAGWNNTDVRISFTTA